MSLVNDEFYKEEIINNMNVFSNICAKQISALYGFDCQISQPEYLKSEVPVGKNFTISIFFTGVIFGEYIFAIDEETAAKFLGKYVEYKDLGQSQEIKEEISDSMSELLNIVVGESVDSLNKQYKHLTITAPRVHYGQIRYPRMKHGKSILKTPVGDIECYLYIDHMKLDIADAYKKALESFMEANQDLKNVLKKLEQQQSFIIQSEKLSALGLMAGGVAHEINNPLAIIQLRTNQLIKSLEKTDDVDRLFFEKALVGIDSTVKRIAKIVSGLRSFARDGSRDPLTDHCASTIIEETLALCQEKFKYHGVVLRFSIKGTDDISCRPSEISQVIINLLNNAYDAIMTSQEKWVEIACESNEDWVKIIVTDAGSGIPKAVQEKLMQPFYTTKEIGKGTGLGLSISKGIIEGHGGKFYYNSQSPNTQFVIELPKRKADDETKRAI